MRHRHLFAASTPIERIGLLLWAVAGFLLLAIAFHWNVTERPFVYRQTHSWTVRIPQPTEGTQGAFWRETHSGWRLYASRCIEEERRKSTTDPMVFNLVLPEACAVRFVPHSTETREDWEQSLGRFWREVMRGRSYTTLFLCAMALLVAGGLLRFGLASKLILWVKNGPREG